MRMVCLVVLGFVAASCDEAEHSNLAGVSQGSNLAEDPDEPFIETTRGAVSQDITFGSSNGNAVFLLNGRLYSAKLLMKDGAAIFLPGPGYPVMDQMGKLNDYLVDFFIELNRQSLEEASRLQYALDTVQSKVESSAGRTLKQDKSCIIEDFSGIKEIELSIEQNVPKKAADAFCDFLKRRGIKIITS